MESISKIMAVRGKFKLFIAFAVVVYLYIYYLESQNNRYYVVDYFIVDKQNKTFFKMSEWAPPTTEPKDN